MNIKSLKRIGIVSVLFFCIFIITGCSSNKNKENETINYTKINVGQVAHEIIDEYSIDNKYLKQWVIENKEIEGLHTKIYEGNTYVLYSMGEKPHYGYGINGLLLYKNEENSPITVDIYTIESNIPNVKKEINYPYIVIKVKGNIKDKFKEKVNNTKEETLQTDENKEKTEVDNTKGDKDEKK